MKVNIGALLAITFWHIGTLPREATLPFSSSPFSSTGVSSERKEFALLGANSVKVTPILEELANRKSQKLFPIV